MKAYKGFNKSLKCMGFQYEIGKEYEEKEARVCECGFHSCLDDNKVFHTGSSSVATNTGDYSVATNTGDCSAATNLGDCSAASVEGEDSVAIAVGYRSKAKGALGCYIVVAERDNNYKLLNVKVVKVDGEIIKADTYYTLVNGKFEEV